MKTMLTTARFFLALLVLAAWPVRAAGPPQQENRFLFVIDTSTAMRPYTNAIVQGVADLIMSDMRGEFRAGDTIGLWTYSDTLQSDYPMQVWAKADKYAILNDMAAYLRGRKFEKRGHLERIMPALNAIIKRSDRLTAILFFDGAQPIQGTPFDKEIAMLQKKYARQLKKAHQPFVTVLAARNGAVFDYTINYPGLIAIPHTAYAEKPPEPKPTVAAAPVTNAPPPKVRHGKSIIMSHSTNTVHSVTVPPPAKVETSAPQTPPAATPTPQPAPVAVQPSAPPVTAQIASVIPPPANPEPKAAPAPAVAVVQPPPALAQQTTPPPAAAVPVVAAPPVVTPATEPAAPVVAAPSAPPPAVNNPPPAKAVLPEAPPASVPPPVIKAAPVTALTPVPLNDTPGAPSRLFATAFVLLAIALVLVVLLVVRRSKAAGESSLISQSIDRPR